MRLSRRNPEPRCRNLEPVSEPEETEDERLERLRKESANEARAAARKPRRSSFGSNPRLNAGFATLRASGDDP